MVGFRRDFSTHVMVGDIAQEIHHAGGDREMPGVKHLYYFPYDFVTAEPFTVRKSRPNQVRKDISSLVTTFYAFVDDAKGRVHPARRARPHHNQRCRWI